MVFWMFVIVVTAILVGAVVFALRSQHRQEARERAATLARIRRLRAERSTPAEPLIERTRVVHPTRSSYDHPRRSTPARGGDGGNRHVAADDAFFPSSSTWSSGSSSSSSDCSPSHSSSYDGGSSFSGGGDSGGSSGGGGGCD